MQKAQTKAVVKDVSIGLAGYVIGSILVLIVKKIAAKVKEKKGSATTIAETLPPTAFESTAV